MYLYLGNDEFIGVFPEFSHWRYHFVNNKITPRAIFQMR
ncbi:hypothetical protein BAZSYMB_V2SCAFFOLD00042_2 [Bathymodiolus azoricus thioautotrophic gill symbiont]|uniref:Uncharacterized protein n=1 Tax=Bathymodiolus azoricus thioautotrophic gill symbiont TaxID=235205 RepID=A0A1H6JMX1_9GAMM|nr:hypothetical protein BAZSYMB_V2SCAFFOLD00042_2 [Bathymodiolus azoricus thioautotrophic gill symbiont]